MAEKYETYATTDVTFYEVGARVPKPLPTETLASADSLFNLLRRYIGIGFCVAPPLKVEPCW